MYVMSVLSPAPARGPHANAARPGVFVCGPRQCAHQESGPGLDPCLSMARLTAEAAAVQSQLLTTR